MSKVTTAVLIPEAIAKRVAASGIGAEQQDAVSAYLVARLAEHRASAAQVYIDRAVTESSNRGNERTFSYVFSGALGTIGTSGRAGSLRFEHSGGRNTYGSLTAYDEEYIKSYYGDLTQFGGTVGLGEFTWVDPAPLAPADREVGDPDAGGY